MFFKTPLRRIAAVFGTAMLLSSVALSPSAQAQNGNGQNNVRQATQANYDSLLHTYYVKKYKGVIDDRYDHQIEQVDASIDETPDSVFLLRLQALPTVIPMTFNDEVRNYIKLYVRTIGRRLDVVLSLSEYYYPLFEEVLSQTGVPLELKHLTIVESALNPKATSRAGAAGLWQFMYRTGRNYGLDVNSLVDERRDPVESTVAAARYLRDLYNIYGDWTLAIAAYNCGPGMVNKAMARSGGKHDFWQLYDYLPRETRGYIPAFIAVNYVMNYYYVHGLQPTRIEIPIHNDTIRMQHDALFCFIEKYGGISVEEIRTLNPQYRTDLVPVSSGYRKLTLPVDIIPRVIRIEDSIYKATRDSLKVKPVVKTTSSAQDRIVYKVKKGETLAKIAKRYDVSERDIRSWNKKHNSTLQAGERLVIYKKGKPASVDAAAARISGDTTAATACNAAVKDSNAARSSTVGRTTTKTSVASSMPQYYTVLRGDNLNSIAKKHGTTASNIRQWNNLRDDRIIVGQKLKVRP